MAKRKVDYCWGSERPEARRKRLAQKLAATQALRAEAERDHQRRLAEIDAIEAVRSADLDEVEIMTHGGASAYDRSLESDPKIAGRTRVENTQALYGRGAKPTRSTMTTQVVSVPDSSVSIREGAKAQDRKRAGRPTRVAPGSRKSRARDAVGTVEMVPSQAVPDTVVEAPVEDAVSQPETLVELPLAAPVMAPALTRELAELLGDVDRPEDDDAGMAEAGSITDKVFDVFSAEVLAERAKRRDPRRLPNGYDASWADHWVMDPNGPVAEMEAEFVTFGTAIDKRPEDLTDVEARFLAGPAMFPKPDDFDPAQYVDRPVPRFFTRELDVPEQKWATELRRSDGSMQKLVASNAMFIDLLVRESERVRRRMWPYAVRRRNFIKGLMDGLAEGEFTFEPASMSPADLERSVRWLVFRDADHNWLLMMANADLEMYRKRIVDKLPWPTGLSRIELLQSFGKGDDLTRPANMSSQGRPPRWMLPDAEWQNGQSSGIIGPDGKPLELPELGFEMGPDFGTTDDMAPIVRDPNIDPDAWG